MWPCCCSSLTCADVRGETRMFQSEEDELSSVRMDITLLKEQYNSIRDKQRRQTQVLCFREAQNSEEMNKTLVDVVPVCLRSPSASVQETLVEFVVDSAGGLWRTHLDVHRLTHTAEVSEHRNHVSSEDSRTSLESERLPEDSNHHLKNSSALNSRKMSFGSYRSTPAGSKYYPFPQRKCPRKSETARRLGLYASF
ncbi:uncharacterized protein C9orf152-like [Chanodichthys erythropterus]|uniref:uncharacterized protein C9orf152-like n=1 Tax=Chanodichthys erythropterus TaxID=933992 RepID=UPI00351E012F